MVWGTPQTPASPDLSGLGTPGEPEGLVPSEPFRWLAGGMYQRLMQPSTTRHVTGKQGVKPEARFSERVSGFTTRYGDAPSPALRRPLPKLLARLLA